MQASLRAARPWVTFMGVAAFVWAGLMAAVAVLNGAGGGSALLAGIYLVGAILYLAPGVFLVRCGGALKRLFDGGGAPDLEDALENQKLLWKYLGLSTIVGVLLALLGVVAFIEFFREFRIF